MDNSQECSPPWPKLMLLCLIERLVITVKIVVGSSENVLFSGLGLTPSSPGGAPACVIAVTRPPGAAVRASRDPDVARRLHIIEMRFWCKAVTGTQKLMVLSGERHLPCRPRQQLARDAHHVPHVMRS